MLRYAILICIISFCYSARRRVEEYDELIISQRTPAIAYIAYISNGTTLSNSDSNGSNPLGFLSEYVTAFDPSIWIIRELRPIQYAIGMLFHCEGPTYVEALPPESFRQQLKYKWPSLYPGRTEDQIWEVYWSVYGNCVKPSPMEYFRLAMVMLDRRNIGRILRNSNILPGGIYELHQIRDAITDALRFRSYIKCQAIPNIQLQYLLEVQTCYNRAHRLKNCTHYLNDPCHPNKSIIYPRWPISQ